MMAYSLKQFTGHEDHGEFGASKRILKILTDRRMLNTAVFIARTFGGIPLGPRRFMHIEKVTKDVLDKLQEIPT